MLTMKDKIIELRNIGLSYNEISKQLGCSKSTVSYYCSNLENNEVRVKSNLEIKNKKQKKEKSFLLTSKVKIDEVVNLRRNKKTYEEIKKITGLSNHIISKICREFGLLSHRKRGEIENDVIEKIGLLYNEIKSIRKVSDILDISRDTVMKYITVNKDKLSTDKIKERKIKNVIEWRKRVKLKLLEYKGGQCVMCGYNKCSRSLEFHHLDPNEKDFTISGKSWSFERLKCEVDKCILVCSNCHNEIHYNEELKKPD